MDSLHLTGEAWGKEVILCNPPWSMLHDLAAELRQSGAAATAIALK
jgi:hypothetical protein